MVTTKTVLVTGASGFIGRATVSALVDAGWRIVRGSRSTSEPTAEGVVYLDLSEPATLLALAKGIRFDAIVHLGAHVGLFGETASELFTPNILSTGCLAHLANMWDAHMIFASSAIVHGVKREVIEADTPISPDTPYANSKWLGEQLLEESHSKHCVLRIAGVFGAGGPTHLGLNRSIDAVIKGEPPLQIGYGVAIRNYVYVKDVAQAIVYALQERLEGTHLLAGHEVMSISSMLREICDTLSLGLHPISKDGPEAMDQIIKPSASLPATRGFCEALIDIRKECQK